MIEWEGLPQYEPVFIHTFVDLRGLLEGDTIAIESNGQTKLKAGLYAVAHSFDPVDKADHDRPNTLVGHYTPHFHSLVNDKRPTLFLVDVESVRSPILGIPDVPFGARPPRHERHYLFLIRRKAEWPCAWDSLINRCHHDLEHDDDDDTWFEEEYKKELIGRLPSGREIYSVKTPEDFAAEVAAKKAEKVAAKKKKEDAASDKAAAKAAKAEENAVKSLAASVSIAQRPAGQSLKHKRVAAGKTSKG